MALWCGVALVLTFPFAFLDGGVFYSRDLHLSVFPSRFVLLESLRNGELPLWNPFSLGGVPLVSQPVHGPWYPPNLLLLLPGSFPRNFTFWIVAHVALAYFTMYRLLRAEEIRRVAAICGATAYAWSGSTISETALPHHLAFAAWAPLFLWSIRRHPQPLLPAAATWALLLTCGSLERALILAPMAAAWIFLAKRSRVTTTIAALAIGTTLAAPSWLPAAALAADAPERAAGFSWLAATVESFGPERFWTLLAPGALTDDWGFTPLRRLYAGYAPIHGTLYAGAASVVAAGLACMRIREDGRIRALAILMLIGMLLAMGRYSPLYSLLWDGFVPLRLFRYPIKFLWFASFAFAALVAFGADRIASPDGISRREASAAFAAFAALLGAAGWTASRLPPPAREFLLERFLGSSTDAILAATGFSVLAAMAAGRPRWARILPLVLFLDLWGNARFAPQGPAEIYEPPPTAERIRGEGLFLRDAAWGAVPNRVPAMRRGATHAEFNRFAMRSSMGALWGVRHVEGTNELAPPHHAEALADLRAQENDTGRFYRRESGVRWRLNHAIASAAPDSNWIERFRDTGAWSVLYEDPQALPRFRLRGGAGSVAREGPDRFTTFSLRVRAETPCLLVMADPLAPGWTARVDGAPVRIRPYLAHLRSVAVPAGASRVEIRYAPPLLAASLLLATASAALLLVCVIGKRFSVPDED